MGKVILMTEYMTDKPITMIGRMAGECYGSDTSDDEKNYKRGLDCLADNHGRTFEFPDIYAKFEGFSARVIREWYTHIGGMPTRLQASTRYINYDNFASIVPPEVQDNPKALRVYNSVIKVIRWGYKKLLELKIPKEDAANILNLGMTTTIVDKRNLRNLMDMHPNRLCKRAYWEFRELLKQYDRELRNISDEWEYIVDNYFKPKCVELEYCPESRTCGMMPRRGE